MRTTASFSTLFQALKKINKEYDNNITFNREPEYVYYNRDLNFTLRVKESSGPGARRGYTGRKMINACWHVHGDFFDAVFEIEPDAVIWSRGQKITKEYGNWEDDNIGSIMNPLSFSEACECE